MERNESYSPASSGTRSDPLGSWIKAAIHHANHVHKVNNVVKRLNTDDSIALEKCSELFKNWSPLVRVDRHQCPDLLLPCRWDDFLSPRHAVGWIAPSRLFDLPTHAVTHILNLIVVFLYFLISCYALSAIERQNKVISYLILSYYLNFVFVKRECTQRVLLVVVFSQSNYLYIMCFVY